MFDVAIQERQIGPLIMSVCRTVIPVHIADNKNAVVNRAFVVVNEGKDVCGPGIVIIEALVFQTYPGGILDRGLGQFRLYTWKLESNHPSRL